MIDLSGGRRSSIDVVKLNTALNTVRYTVALSPTYGLLSDALPDRSTSPRCSHAHLEVSGPAIHIERPCA